MPDITSAAERDELDDLVDSVFGDLITDEDTPDMPRLRALLRPDRVTSTRSVLESADLDIRTCQHELAYGLAALAGLDVSLDPPPVEFEYAARRLRAFLRTFPKCQLKGAS